MALPFHVAETLRRNGTAQRAAGRRPQVHEQRRGDSLLVTRLDAIAAPSRPRWPDPVTDDRDLRWSLGDLYDVVYR